MSKVTVLILILVNTSAFAGPRARAQHQRIKAGVKSGEITRPELHQLRKEKVETGHTVKELKEEARADDGKIGLVEKARIQRAKQKLLDERSKQIKEFKSN